jgi:energy-coupling factor transporter ATP-binding protein EcfA2
MNNINNQREGSESSKQGFETSSQLVSLSRPVEGWTLVEKKKKRSRPKMNLPPIQETETAQCYVGDNWLLSPHLDNLEPLDTKYSAWKDDNKRHNHKESRSREHKIRRARYKKKNAQPHSSIDEVNGDISLSHEPAEIDLRREERRLLAQAAVETPPQDITCDQSEELSQLLDSIHDIANIDGDDEIGDWVSHLENLVIMAYQVSRARSFVDIFVAVVAYIKMNTKKCILKQLLQLIDEVTDKCPTSETEPHAWSGQEVVQKWELFKTNTIFTKVSYLLSAAMSLSVCTIKEIEWSPFGLQLISVEAAKQQLKAVDVIDAVISTFSWVADTGYRVFQEKSLLPLLYADNKMKQFNEDCDYVLANAEQAVAGNVGCINDFEKKVDDVLRAVCEMKSVKCDGPTALWLQQRYSQLIKIKHQIVAKHRNTAIRFQPFGVGLTGSSGVGKSTLAKIVMKVSLHAMGFETDQKRIITKDMFDPYDSTYTSDILGMFMDDVGNGKSKFAKVAPTDIIIKFFNNMAAQAVKAELNAKGVVFIAFKVGVLTSNFKDYQVRQYSDKPEASLRRFVHTRVRVKPHYRKPGSISLDTGHPDLEGKELTHDVWNLDLEECHIFENKKGEEKYEFKILDVKLQDGTIVHCKDLDLDTYLDVIVALAKKHKQKQTNVIARSKRFDDMKMCDTCCKPVSICKCAVNPDALESIGEVIVDAAKNSVTSYINKWLSPVNFLNSALGFRPVKQMATQQLEGEMKQILNDTVTPWMIAITPDWLFRTSVFKKSIELWQHSAAMYDLKRQARFGIMSGSCFVVLGLVRKDKYMTGTAIGGSWLVSMAFWAQYRARIAHYKEEYMRRRNALPAHANNLRDGKVAKGAFVVTTLVVGLKLFRMWNNARLAKIRKEISPDGITKEEIEGQPGWFDFFTRNIGVTVDRTKESCTATTDQVAREMRKTTFFAWFERTDGSKTRCDIFFPRKGVALIPRHVFYPNADMTQPPSSELKVEVIRHKNRSGGLFSFKCAYAQAGTCERLDMVAVHVDNCPDLPDQRKWFPKDRPKGNSICKLIVRTEDDLKVRRVSVEHGVVGHMYMDFYGGSYTTELARTGACMAPLVLDLEKPTIVGFHIGGDPNRNYGVMQTVTIAQLDELIKDLKQKPGVLISAQSTELPTEQYGRQLIESEYVHPHCMAAKLDAKAYVDVLGSTRLRMQQGSQVMKSPISDEVEKHFEYPNKWGSPKLKPNWKGYNATLEHIVNPADMFSPLALERARQDWLKPLVPLMRKHMMDESFRPLNDHEIVMGQAGKRFVTPIPMNTGMGFPVFGKKSKHFIETRDGETLITREPDEAIKKEMARIMECWLRGERAYPVTTATLKDEPTPLEKEKVRVFQASAIAMGMYIRKYFLPIARFLALHPLESESAVGVNAFSKQWEELMAHSNKYALDSKVIAWDYSKYDVRMNSQITTAVWLSFIELAEVGGYPQDALEVMRNMIADIVHPLIDYNGTMLMAYNMNTSGNNMTVNVNSTAGSFYVRLGFFNEYPDATDFRSCVSALTYGDDFKGSVHPDYRRFGFCSMSKFLGAHKMKITPPDKSDNIIDFMEDEDADFLKRNSVFIPEIGRNIGALSNDSIMKSLHANLKSKSQQPMAVAVSCIETAMHEWFGHGREIYEDKQARIKKVCEHFDLPIPAVDLNYDERVEAWLKKYS